MNLRAEFAIRSKQPGDTQEYRVLAASSGALQAEDFEAIFRKLSVGSAPPNGRSVGDDAPVATCGTYTASGDTYVAVIRQERTELRDSGGRPVSAYCCACVPYSELTSNPIGYLEVYRCIPPHEELRKGVFPQRLEVEALEIKRLQADAALIDRVGYEFCAAVAARLLEGGVALMRGQDLEQRKRLECLQAIASLLPYGARATLSLSTWMQSASMHSIRLGFSDQARRHETRVVWGSTAPTDFAPGGGAEQYFRMLLDLRQLDGVEPYSILDILTHLEAQREPLGFDAPQRFIRVLYALNEPYLVWKAARERRADSRHVRNLFHERRTDALGEAQLLDLLRFLLSSRQLTAEDVRVASDNWRDILWPDLLDAARARLDDRDGASALDMLCSLASEKGGLARLLDAILQAAVTDPPSEQEPHARRQTAASLLLAWWPTPGVEDRWTPQDLRSVLGSLARHRALLYDFVLAAVRRLSPSELDAVFARLERVGSAVANDLSVFEVARGRSREDVSGESVRRLASAGPGYVPALVEMALSSGTVNESLDRVLGGVVACAAGHPDACIRRDDLEAWRALLPRLGAVRRPSPRLTAEIDLCALLLDPGSPPPFLTLQLGEPMYIFAPYAEVLVRGARALGSAAMVRVLNWLIANDCASLRCTENALHALDGLLAAEADATERNKAYLYILSMVDRYPDLLDESSFTEQWEMRLSNEGYALRVAETRLRKRLDSHTPVPEAAGHCARLVTEHGRTAEQVIIRVLNEKRYLDSVERFREFRETLQLGQEGGLSPEKSQQLAARLEEAVLAGRLAPTLSRMYRRAVIKERIGNLEKSIASLAGVAEHLREDDLAALAHLLKKLQGIGPQKGLGAWLRGR